MMLLAAAVFIGSQVCRPCHSGIFEAYVPDTDGTFQRSRGIRAPAQFTAAGHSIGSMTTSCFRRRHRRRSTTSSDRMPRAAPLLTARDGYLFELPVTWYAQKQTWDASPGYENDAEVRLTRAVEPELPAVPLESGSAGPRHRRIAMGIHRFLRTG